MFQMMHYNLWRTIGCGDIGVAVVTAEHVLKRELKVCDACAHMGSCWGCNMGCAET
jgi:hypothetical protein